MGCSYSGICFFKLISSFRNAQAQFSVLQRLAKSFIDGAITKYLFSSVEQTSELTAIHSGMFYWCYRSREGVPGTAWGVGWRMCRARLFEFWRINGHSPGILSFLAFGTPLCLGLCLSQWLFICFFARSSSASPKCREAAECGP